MNHQIILLSLTSVVAVSGIACNRNDSAEIKLLKWVETADPITDSKAALAKGDHRLLAIRGLIVSLPGVDSLDTDYYKQQYGVKEIEGTTDGLVNHEHRVLVQRAIDYAKIYNLMIVRGYKPNVRP